jgi:hypothetical protein
MKVHIHKLSKGDLHEYKIRWWMDDKRKGNERDLLRA